jgi:sulfotransferase
MSGTSIAKRAEIWLNSQPVGLALERLSEIINRGWAEHIHFIKFEDFVKSPKREMEKIYDYLEMERYDHDFKKVDQVTKEDDTVYGTYGDHTINPVVTDLPRDFYDVLGVQASNYIRQFGEFYFDYFKYDPLKKGRNGRIKQKQN